jgi:putative NADH-flavin reductase
MRDIGGAGSLELATSKRARRDTRDIGGAGSLELATSKRARRDTRVGIPCAALCSI